MVGLVGSFDLQILTLRQPQTSNDSELHWQPVFIRLDLYESKPHGSPSKSSLVVAFPTAPWK